MGAPDTHVDTLTRMVREVMFDMNHEDILE